MTEVKVILHPLDVVTHLTKKYNKNCYVIFGGLHATLKADEVLKNTEDVDFVVSGEGEAVLLELISTLSSKSNNFSTISGLSYRCGDKNIHNNAGRFIDDLHCLPFPDRETLLGLDTYTSEDLGLLMGSRGCPYNCSYCATQIWTRRVRYRSLTNIIDEIKDVQHRYGTHQFTFKDDSFTVNRKRVMEFVVN